MSGCIIPEGYTPRLNVYETQRAIEFIKRSFQKNLGSALNLKRVSAPLFVRTDTGLNDDLNGDIIFRNTVLDRAFEVSSMGIRVSPESMDRQLTLAGCDDRRKLPFHKALLAGEMPFTMGGGVGQSRLCMLLIGCAHIGEVQSGIWDEETVNLCKARGVHLL